jgi:hypothetical protein
MDRSVLSAARSARRGRPVRSWARVPLVERHVGRPGEGWNRYAAWFGALGGSGQSRLV